MSSNSSDSILSVVFRSELLPITDQQELVASVLTNEQEVRIRNKLCAVAVSKCNRVLTKGNVDTEIAENNYEAGMIAAFQLLLAESEDAKETIANNQKGQV